MGPAIARSHDHHGIVDAVGDYETEDVGTCWYRRYLMTYGTVGTYGTYGTYRRYRSTVLAHPTLDMYLPPPKFESIQ